MSDKIFSSNKRFVVGIIAAMMLFVVLFSSFFIAVESAHDCTGEDCPICSCIQQCENTLRNIGNGLLPAHMDFSPIILFMIASVLVVSEVQIHSLVSKKVRLNN